MRRTRGRSASGSRRSGPTAGEVELHWLNLFECPLGGGCHRDSPLMPRAVLGSCEFQHRRYSRWITKASVPSDGDTIRSLGSTRPHVSFGVNEDLVTPAYLNSPQEPHDPTAQGNSPDEIWVVRANSDEQAKRFVDDGYVGIGWFNLSSLHSPEDIWPQLRTKHPPGGSEVKGQLQAFRFQMKKGDYVIIPSTDSEFLYYGNIAGPCEPYEGTRDDSIQNLRKVSWNKSLIPRSALSDRLKTTLSTQRTGSASRIAPCAFRFIEDQGPYANSGSCPTGCALGP